MKSFRHSLLALFIGSALALSGTAAHAAKNPRCLATDSRVCQLVYDPNQVYEITGVYGYTTTIEFAPGEKILNKAIGDSIAWQVLKFRNHIVLKPTEPNARTNLTITTSNHVYYFRLSSSNDPKRATYGVQFVYTNDDAEGKGGDGDNGNDGWGSSDASYAPPRVVNKNYQVSGNEAQYGLQRVFDDGQFTYFLTDASKAKPSIYVVGSDGTEQLVNVRREGPYLVVEQMAERFTLRDGSDRTLCVRRDTATGNGATRSVAQTGQNAWGGGH